MNAVGIESAISDLALEPFDATEFPFASLAAFGNKETTLKRLRVDNNNTSDVLSGVLRRNNIHIAVCEADSVGATLNALRTSPATTKAKFILATDGQTLEAEKLASGETIACDYIAKAQVKPVVTPDSMANDAGVESMSFVCAHRQIITANKLTCQYRVERGVRLHRK